MEQSKSDHIPFRLNFCLTLGLLFQSFVASFLFAKEDLTPGKVNISKLRFLKDHREAEIMVGIAAMVAAILIFMWILLKVWNGVFAKRLNVQRLGFSEAYAVSILFFAITSWF